MIMSGLYRTPLLPQSSVSGGANGVVQIDGPKWREQRRFALHVLRDFGVGRAQMESKIMEEVVHLELELQWMASYRATIAANALLSSVLLLTQDSTREHHFVHSIVVTIDESALFSPMCFLIRFWLRTVVNHRGCRYRKSRSLVSPFLSLITLLERLSIEFRSGYSNTVPPLFCGKQTPKGTTKNLQKPSLQSVVFSDWQMKMLLLDLFFAGMETTVTTLKWGFLLAVLHPNVQRRVQEELDNECAGTAVTLADRPRLPYTQATINEIQRVANILPINLLRTVSEDVSIDGFEFPAKTLVIPQISILMNDESVFPDAKAFRPERFLGEDGKLRRVDEFLPFSVGKRQCLGESLARAELFLIFGNLLKRFEFRPTPGSWPSKQRVFGLTVSPPQYECVVQLRKRDENHNFV
ncbi:unnamed protein product [Heligmosomoides polygyrus]|uniref:Cytochrome P450 n=1 Tax=Heligmosomoides polygyrus TaxID=6339 RepID=A0A3P8B0Q4_HELPZ|nr:unnamed protein product [Heligmosomoides polygyrus]